MAKLLQQVSATCPSRQPGSYLYAIAAIGSSGGGRGGPAGLGAITSADELLVLHPEDLLHAPTFLNPVPTGVSCLSSSTDDHGDHQRPGNVLFCGGRDGSVLAYDLRAGAGCMAALKQGRPITALTLRGADIATGTELVHHDAVVSLWDMRAQKIMWQTTELNDDVTALAVPPNTSSRSNYLLAGGIDGTVAIFDTHITEADDSLVQALNEGPIHKAGFFGQDHLYALTGDEHLSVYPVTAELPDDDASPSAPVILGDLRPVVPCDYVIDLLDIGGTMFVVTGTHRQDPHIDLIPLSSHGQLKVNKKLTTLGAHGEEVVRDVYGDFASETVFTAGEDGFVRAFRAM